MNRRLRANSEYKLETLLKNEKTDPMEPPLPAETPNMIPDTNTAQLLLASGP